MKVSLSFCVVLILFAAAGCASKADSEPKLAASDAGMQPDVGVTPMDSGVEAGADAAMEPMVPAFPGAVGWAGNTPGGRGGQILRVTTLSSLGPGSFREALAYEGPRIIVFEVGGVIELGGNIAIEDPYVTVAGQTAPSPGITFVRGGLTVETHDVILQHIRVRPGEAGYAKMSGWEIDSISTYGAVYNVIVDHCSVSWGTDENLSASGPRFNGATPDVWRMFTSHAITFSNNIVAEGLANATHSEGEHSKGGLIHDNVTNVTIVGNLYFSNNDRHPLFKGGARGVVVNNYLANPGRWAMMYALNEGEWGANPYQTGQMSIVGNVFTYGPSTPDGVPLFRASGQGMVEAYFEDNVAQNAAGDDVPQVGGTAALVTTVDSRPLWPDNLTPMPASELAQYIQDNVGARPWDRDAIDARIVEQALAGEGAIIDSENDVGGYPMHAETQAAFVEADWDLETMTRKNEGG